MQSPAHMMAKLVRCTQEYGGLKGQVLVVRAIAAVCTPFSSIPVSLATYS